jgi:DHA2 family multidrug resistance protein
MTPPSESQQRWILVVGTMLATMLYSIDATIVNVALPQLQGSLQATQDQVAWVLTSYIVVSAIATPLSGWMGTRYGLRPMMLTCVAGFTIISMLCGLATSLSEMVAFRMLQGAFGAALVPLSQVVLLQEFPREQHGRVTAFWGMGVLIGPVIGPVLGGLLTDSLSWRWAFYINMPVGIFAFLALLVATPARRCDAHRPFDLLGFILLSLAVGLFQLMLDRGQTLDWFDSTEIIAEAFFSVVCLYMFVVHSMTKAHPFVDMQLFRSRNFVVTLVVMFALGMSVFSAGVLLPSFLQQLQGYSATQAGALTAARGITAMIAMLVAGRLMGVIDLRITVAVGMLFSSVALWLMSGFTLDVPSSHVLAAGFLLGAGTLTFVPLSIAAYTTLSPSQRAEAGVLMTLVRNIGSAVGVSVAVALVSRSAQTNQSYMAERFTPYAVERWFAVGAEPGNNLTTTALLGDIARQAAMIAYNNVYYLLAMAGAASLVLVLLLNRHVDKT